MSKRNLILLIIIIIIIAIGLGFFFLNKSSNQADDNTEGTNFFTDFFPFGKSNTVTPADNTNGEDAPGSLPDTDVSKQSFILKKVSSFPVAGYIVFMKERFKEIPNPSQTLPERGDISELSPSGEVRGGPTPPESESAPTLRYVDRITGNIYQTFMDNIDERKFSSTIIPRVYEAHFGDNGESVVMRYLKDDGKTIESFLGNLPKEYLGADAAGTNEVRGTFLPDNISDMSISPDTSKTFYLFNTGDVSIGAILNTQTNTKVQVFSSPFTEWLSSWPNDGMITVTTKPSTNVLGYMYSINPSNNDFNKVLGNINGLTTLTSPDGKKVLYGDNGLSLTIYDINTTTSMPIGLKTLPEKCVWGNVGDIVYCAVPKYLSPQVDYPDSWYQGETSFSDEIWKIDAINTSTEMLLDLTSAPNGEDIDAIKLSLDENENYLSFINKKDSYLWELKLK